MRTLTVACLASAVTSCGAPAREPAARPAPPVVAPAVAALPREPAPLGRLPGDVRPTREALVLDIDPARDRFGGTAELALHLDHPRDQIWLHGRGLAVKSVTVATGAAPIAARWDEVDPIGVARISLPAPVTGDVVVRIAFDAAYDPSLVGVYRTQTAAGPAVFSKFEAIYARRAFPCFDEPAFKIPFDVTLTVPAGQVVIGNMPVASDTAQGAGRRVQFRATPPLPSYLIAFAVGPFEQRTTELAASAVRPAALPIGAVALRGRANDTAFALGEEPALLAEQERYFGVAFPFPKLDLIAVPDFQSGAMENAGAITFRDSALLVDDKVASLAQRIGVTSVIAHETAHQWFGDLVTMRWWDDLWLNEGFATFLADRTLRAVRPALEIELKAAGSANEVMNLDSLASARRIRQPIETTHDITNAFDGITYQKGAAVLAMLEHYLGDEPFRAGLHDFLTAHAGGNATTDELVAALAKASGKPLAAMAASFLDQPGVPVVSAHARCETGHGSVELGQARWRPLGATLADARWTIPVCVRAGIGARIEEVCTVLDAPTGTLALPGCADWILPNAGATGYYRSALPAEDLARLRDRGLRKLATVERVAYGNDLVAAFRSGALPGGDVLRALEPLARDRHGAVAAAPLGLWRFVDDQMVLGKARQALRARLARLYAPALAALGWRPAASDPPWRRLFRTQLVNFLALQIGDPATLGEAARLGRRLLGVDRDHVRHTDVAPDVALAAMSAAARTGGAEVFDALVAQLVGSGDAQLREYSLLALGAARDPALVQRALDLALDPRLRQNERLATFRVLAGAVGTRDLAWAWLEAHFDALVPLLPDRFGGQLPSMIAMCDPAMAERVRAFLAPRMAGLTGGPRNLAQALESATQCAARVAAQHDSVARYVQ